MDPRTQQWQLTSAEHTYAAGEALGRALAAFALERPLLVTLSGELGAGKTTFVGGVLAAFGHVGPVRSPTYTLIEPYESLGELQGRDVYHLDLYRLTDPAQLEELGIRDLMQPSAILLVEWPERAGDLLDKPDLAIQLAYPSSGTEGRTLSVAPMTESGHQLIDNAYSSTTSG